METAKITLDDVQNIPPMMKNNSKLIESTDYLLQYKFDKIRIFKSFWMEKTEETIAEINALNAK